mmetsp:Transcript_7595/g.13141  ORF Transcript_7595/g.13141 Transcript_7595/m.13141 type:complete len:206 (-) Transcript_7595:169-786(-)
MNNHSMVYSGHFLERSCHEGHEFWMEYTNHSSLSSGSVGHGSQNVEARPNTQLFANRGDVFHGRMIHRSKHEGNVALFNTFDHLIRSQVDLYTKSLQHIGRSTPRRHRTVPSLGNCTSTSSTQDNRCCANIDRIRSISTRTDNIQQLFVPQIHRVAGCVHGFHHSCYFRGGFPACPQQRQQGSHLYFIGSTENFAKGSLGLLRCQ